MIYAVTVGHLKCYFMFFIELVPIKKKKNIKREN